MSTTIYALRDPRTGQTRYVGKTGRSVTRRLRRHLCDAIGNGAYTRTRVGRWIKSLVALALEPVPIVLETLPDDADWAAAERRWIATLRSAGCPLTNLTDGGEGLYGYVASPAARERIAKSKRGKTRSATTRAKIAAALTGRRQSVTTIAKRVAALRGRPGRSPTEDTRRKIAAALVGRSWGNHTPATKTVIGAASRRRVVTQVTRDKLRTARKTCGERHPNAKLSDADVAAIRTSLEPGPVLAARYGISRATANKIRSGRARKSVPS